MISAHSAAGARPEGLRGTEATADATDQIWVAVQGLNDGDVVLQGALGPLREGLAVNLLPASQP